VVVTLAGCESPEEARALAGSLLAVPEAEALPLPPGQFYPWQLEGCRVVTADGREVGTVAGVENSTAQEVWVVRDGRREHLINSTNRLLKSRYQILAGKTGYIHESGYCFATWLRADGRDLIAVVLGAPTNATRFADVVRLVQRTVAAGLQPAKS
jgi:hypothetical protein